MSESASTTFSETFTSTATATATASATASDAGSEFVPPPPSISITTPLLYVSILVVTLVLFSIYHRKNKINSLTKLTSESLFESSYDVQTTADDLPTADSTPSVLFKDLQSLDVHEKLIKVALIERAAESIRRIIKLKESEPSIMLLYSRGLIGDDSFKRYQLQSKLQDAEMQEIAKQAETIKQGWSKLVFLNAQEVMMNQALRRRLASIDSRFEVVENIETKGIETVVKDIQARVIELK